MLCAVGIVPLSSLFSEGFSYIKAMPCSHSQVHRSLPSVSIPRILFLKMLFTKLLCLNTFSVNFAFLLAMFFIESSLHLPLLKSAHSVPSLSILFSSTSPDQPLHSLPFVTLSLLKETWFTVLCYTTLSLHSSYSLSSVTFGFCWIAQDWLYNSLSYYGFYSLHESIFLRNVLIISFLLVHYFPASLNGW